MHCVNHLLLPMLQSWLRRGNQITGYWESSTANFKQCAGFCTDLVVEYTVQFASMILFDMFCNSFINVNDFAVAVYCTCVVIYSFFDLVLDVPSASETWNSC